MELKTVGIKIPEGANMIFGQTHFIKSAEDLYEAMTGAVPGAKFGIAFCEASGACLVRCEGNDDELREAAAASAVGIGCGHTFIIFMRNAYPINVLNAIKSVPEVCNIFCATANPVEVVVAQTSQGRGVLGVIDGSSPLGVEEEQDVKERRAFIRKIGYKK